jgi:hypothetical protein
MEEQNEEGERTRQRPPRGLWLLCLRRRRDPPMKSCLPTACRFTRGGGGGKEVMGFLIWF